MKEDRVEERSTSEEDTPLFYDPDHRTAFAVDPSASLLASIRHLIGLPAGDNRTGTLVTTIDDVGLPLSAIEESGHEHGADIVFGLFGAGDVPAAPFLFALGVRLHWKYLWHPRFQLWLSRTGEPATFVPAALDANVCFRIEDGRLFADDRMPFASAADRGRGILAAHAILSSVVEG